MQAARVAMVLVSVVLLFLVTYVAGVLRSYQLANPPDDETRAGLLRVFAFFAFVALAFYALGVLTPLAFA